MQQKPNEAERRRHSDAVEHWKTVWRNQDDDLQRLMRTEFARDYRQIMKHEQRSRRCPAYLDLNMGRGRRTDGRALPKRPRATLAPDPTAPKTAAPRPRRTGRSPVRGRQLPERACAPRPAGMAAFTRCARLQLRQFGQRDIDVHPPRIISDRPGPLPSGIRIRSYFQKTPWSLMKLLRGARGRIRARTSHSP